MNDIERVYKDHPKMKEFLLKFPSRFSNEKQKAKCDGDLCITEMSVYEFNIFVTPEPELQPLMLCRKCIQKYILKHDLTKLQ